MIKKTLGGDRLGSGKKMEVELHGYERSTHDLGYLWRSTMSAGTLVPFLSEVALPGDTFDINLDCDIKTHPTVGPLFGSYKVQLDIFQAPIRLYNAYLHNNTLGIGMRMAEIFFPVIELTANKLNLNAAKDISNSQINPSAIFSYLGIRGVGMYKTGIPLTQERYFNALPWLAYWEIYKNYYANKQEEKGAVIHGEIPAPRTISITLFQIDGTDLPSAPANGHLVQAAGSHIIQLEFDQNIGVTATADWLLDNILIYQGINQSQAQPVRFFVQSYKVSGNEMTIYTKNFGIWLAASYDWIDPQQMAQKPPEVHIFDLNDIDRMREEILKTQSTAGAFQVNGKGFEPYDLINHDNGVNPLLASQEGLAVKTYQSDLFNNWLSTEWIDGVDGITEITAIDTSGGSFTIDTLNLSKKVYMMLNRIAVSGGSYDDWIDAVFAHDRYVRAESPIYHGGLIRELVFQEVVSNSGTTETADQPLGTLAGKGVMAQKKKGGEIIIRVDEPSYILGIISLTPRVDYSQGNKWDVHLRTMDDLHKPALDEIGFQELITEQMAWWDTEYTGGTWLTFVM